MSGTENLIAILIFLCAAVALIIAFIIIIVIVTFVRYKLPVIYHWYYKHEKKFYISEHEYQWVARKKEDTIIW